MTWFGPTLDDFDPNNQRAPVVPEWATYAPRRKTKWKVHSNLGHAKNAFYIQLEIILYHHEDGRWVEKCRVEEKKPEWCEQCGTNLMKENRYYPELVRLDNIGRYIWSRKEDLKFLCVCPRCEWQIKYPKQDLPKYLQSGT